MPPRQSQAQLTVTLSFTVILGLLIFAESSALAQPLGDERLMELELRGWAPTLHGLVRYGADGSALNLDSDLGVNTQQQFLWPRISLHFARHRLSVSYLDMNYAGDKQLTQTIQFGNSTFAANTAVHTDIQFREILTRYQYEFLTGTLLAANVNLQVHYIHARAELQSSSVGSRHADFEIPVPTIGAGLRFWPYKWVQLEGSFNAIKGGVSGKRGELLDGQAALTISPWSRLGFSLGYRYYKLIGVDTAVNNRFDWLQKGPYISLTARF